LEAVRRTRGFPGGGENRCREETSHLLKRRTMKKRQAQLDRPAFTYGCGPFVRRKGRFRVAATALIERQNYRIYEIMDACRQPSVIAHVTEVGVTVTAQHIVPDRARQDVICGPDMFFRFRVQKFRPFVRCNDFRMRTDEDIAAAHAVEEP
jgi:hypothetical protein